MKVHSMAFGALALSLALGPVSYGAEKEKKVAAAPAAAPADAAAPAAAGAKLASADEAFLKKAAMGNMAEVKLGEMVKDKATAQEVKDFANMMVTDHSKAQEDLQGVATAKGVQLPADLDAKHKALSDKLAKLSGAELDKAYMEEMLKDHKKDVGEYEAASKSVKDPELKAYVDKTLPVLKTHLEHAQSASGKAKSGQKPASEKKGA